MDCLPKVAKYKNIIIDVRQNSGGDIRELESIVDQFLPAGSEYIKAREREYEGGVARTLSWHSWVTKSGVHSALQNKKLAVLVDEGTASSSEILVAALKDCAGAIIVGQKTYGKGIGQVIINRRDRPTFQITFLQLRGVSTRIGDYHNRGIAPDFATIPSNFGLGKHSATDPVDEQQDELSQVIRIVEPDFNGTINSPPRRNLNGFYDSGCYKIISE
jgi:carboxyl-terminal processing protease